MTDAAAIPPSRAIECVCLRFRKAARRVTQIYDQHLGPAGLTITQFGLLGHLRSYPGIGIGALAETLLMDPTTLTRNLKPLERRGLIRMEPDPRDRRARRLDLTVAGLTAFRAGRPLWAEAQRHVAAMLGQPDVGAINATLDRMLDQLSP